jgi:hypothetical protein
VNALTAQLRAIVVMFSGLSLTAALPAQTVAVHYKEGSIHGFLSLSTLEGDPIAAGDLMQVAHGNQITSHLVFHFKDGSLQDETTVFSQRDIFSLISYRLIQKGPAFKNASEIAVSTATGQVTVRYTDDKGEEKVETEHMKLPPDLANGLILTLLKNVRPGGLLPKLSMVVATPKPRIVKLAISSAGNDSFSLEGSKREAAHYVIKVEIGGVAGVVAPLVGKQPPDAHVWVLGGEIPAFVKSETLSFMGGPLWRTELLSPSWPKSGQEKTSAAAKP